MTRYNHMYTIAYSLVSEHEHGDDVTPAMHRAALEKRMDAVDEADVWDQAVGGPEDTYVETGT